MRARRFVCAIVVAAGCWFASPAEAGTFVVSPSGGDDTAAIQQAFDAAVAAGPGNTVQLTAGEFWTGFVEVSGFEGKLIGAGTTETVVRSVPDLPCAAQVAVGSLPALLKFRGGAIQISDLTLAVEDLYPCDSWALPSLPIPRNDLAAVVMLTGAAIDTSFDCDNPIREVVDSAIDNVAFRGHPDWVALSTGVHNIVRIEAEVDDSCERRSNPLSGSHHVSNSSFEHAQVALDVGLTDGVLRFGSPGAGNAIDDVEAAMVAVDNSNSALAFTHNRVTRARVAGVGILQGQWNLGQLASEYVVSHNRVEAVELGDGVAVYDYNYLFLGAKTADLLISQNSIDLDTEWGGVFGFAQDVLVMNNRFTGSGFAGVYVGLFGLPSSGWTLTGNNSRSLDAVVAPVVLGPDSSDCTVVGGPNLRTALDLGTDNILVGVDNQGQLLGPALQAAMEEKRRLLEALQH